MQRRRVGVIAIERGQHDFQPLTEQVVLQGFHGGFIFRVADQVQLRRPARRLRGGCRFRLFLGRCQAANEIFLEQVQVAFDDLRAMVEGRIFLHAEHERALSLGRRIRHPPASRSVAADRACTPARPSGAPARPGSIRTSLPASPRNAGPADGWRWCTWRGSRAPSFRRRATASAAAHRAAPHVPARAVPA